jgi:polyphosphate kinase
VYLNSGNAVGRKSNRSENENAETVRATPESQRPDRRELIQSAWFDRDLGWLEFNRRVLHEAQDERTPLLERLKFLAIFSSNLDEFFMKRISVLRENTGDKDDDPGANHADATPLVRVRQQIREMLEAQAHCYRSQLRPALAKHGIHIVSWDDLTSPQQYELERYFESHISPALTPLGFDPAHPFPFMSNQSTNWGFVLRDPVNGETTAVRVKIPTMLQPWLSPHVDIEPGTRCFIGIEDVIYACSGKLFPGMEILGGTLFRIIRDAEVELDEDEGDSLRDVVSEALRRRRFEPVVRIDFGPNPDPTIRSALLDKLQLSDADTYDSSSLIDYTTLFQLAAIDVPELRDRPWAPQLPPRLADEDADIFAAIQSADLLVHHPYESFDASVQRFIDDAADDPLTVAIKMTVYRVGDDTPFVRSLIRAAESGKQVACVIELKARFDEARNIHWAQALEKVGAHVTYGVLGLKTHTKVALVVRKEGAELRCYAHIGTGNYHVKTARLYTDVGLFTCDRLITEDVVNLFHYLTGRARSPRFRRLLVAPVNMREQFLSLIEREIEHHTAGRPARIIAKMNQLEDIEISRALVEASRSGVPIDLIVRGFCCLKPGIEGFTENVRVRSIIGRFLEHSRIFYFANGSEDPLRGDYVIGSADWMYRNLSRRVEAAVPVDEPLLRERLWEILSTCLVDQRQAWVMQSDGSYVQLQPEAKTGYTEANGTHPWLMLRSRTRQSLPLTAE